MEKVKYAIASLSVCLLALVTGPGNAAPADDVKALLEQQKPLEAYGLARSNSGEMGNPVFDFFYGIAAIDAGHAGEGVLALERYLLRFPDNRSARFQLARGYYVLGEDQRARDEFQQLLVDASGSEKTTAERYLDAIKAREGRYRPTATGFLEAGLGFDSNVNSGIPGGSTFSLPGGTSLSLAPNSVLARSNDNFATLQGGVQGTYPLAPGVAAFGTAGFDSRFHSKSNFDQFDQANFGGAGGLSFLTDRNLYKAGIGLSEGFVDKQRYLTTTSLFGEWQHQYDQFNRFSLGAQLAGLDFHEMTVFTALDKSAKTRVERTPTRDSTYSGLSAGWSRNFNVAYLPVLNVSLNYGDEANRANRPDLSREIHGARVGVSLTPAPQWGAAIAAGVQETNYKAKGAFAASRKDETYTVDGSLSYFYSKALSVRLEAAVTQQQSNVGLFTYDRYVVGVKARYDFK
jgi:hypothetical protein